MKTRHFFLVATIAVILGSCGGGNIGAACDTATSTLFEHCDLDGDGFADEEFVGFIFNAFNPVGISVPLDQIRTSREDEVNDLCVDGLNEAEADISDEDLIEFEAAMNASTDCESASSTLNLYLNLL